MSAAKAERLLGWRHGDVEARVAASVAWHLAHPPPSDGEFDADDRALASVR